MWLAHGWRCGGSCEPPLTHTEPAMPIYSLQARARAVEFTTCPDDTGPQDRSGFGAATTSLSEDYVPSKGLVSPY